MPNPTISYADVVRNGAPTTDLPDEVSSNVGVAGSSLSRTDSEQSVAFGMISLKEDPVTESAHLEMLANMTGYIVFDWRAYRTPTKVWVQLSELY